MSRSAPRRVPTGSSGVNSRSTSRTSRAGATRTERPGGLRALASALAASTAVHVALLLLIALAVVGYQGSRFLTTSAPPLVATLAPATDVPDPAPRPAIEFVPLDSTPSNFDERVATSTSRPSPPSPPARMSGKGMTTINNIDSSDPAEPHHLALVRELYPAAKRAPLAFETPPTGFYPAAAVERQVQLNARVLVIVHPDGRLELPLGSFEDPIFAPAIRASLATGKAHPLTVGGEARQSWALLSFSFEFVGGP